MGWFSIVSILVFVALMVRCILGIRENRGKARNYMLIVIFSIHIGVIVYLSLD